MTAPKWNGWILIIALLAYTGALFQTSNAAYHYNDNHFSYTLDDAFIHMAMSKHIAENGVFGITPYEFSASSSSPLWTFLLAGIYKLTGPLEWIPLVMNWIFGLGIIVMLWLFSRRAQIGNVLTAGLIGAVIVFMPMIPIAMTGMEHLLHTFTVMGMLYTLWARIDSQAEDGFRPAWPLFIWSALAVSSRFETLFFAAAIALVLVFRKKWKSTVSCLAGTFIPVVSFGIYWMANGQSFLPNSVLLKGQTPNVHGIWSIIHSLGLDSFNRIVDHPHLYVLVFALLIGWWKSDSSETGLGRNRLFALLMILSIAMHAQFAKIGWFYRYESYLIVLSFTVISVLIHNFIKERIVKYALADFGFTIMAFTLFFGPFSLRATEAHNNTVQASHNIYQQQYLNGLFLKKYYNGVSMAANDIGAINFHASLKCLDLWGLGSRETMLIRRAGKTSTETIREVTQKRGVKIAVVYSSWFKDNMTLPEEWITVGTLSISHNVICGDDAVTFIATSPGEAEKLRQNLTEFSKTLPKDVIWEDLSED